MIGRHFCILTLSVLTLCQGSTALKSLQIDDSLNRFGLNLLKHCAPGENVMISPYSLSTAIAMLNAGAAGTSKAEIDTALGWMGVKDVSGQYQTLIQSVNSEEESVFNISSSNRMYLDNEFYPLVSYTAVLTDSFDADLKRVDFGSQETVEEINSWVEDQTNGKIKEMFEDIDSNTKSILINTVYFNAQWKYPFVNTVNRPFYLDKNSQIEVETMIVQAPFSYYRSKKAHVVRLPYVAGDRDISMIVIQPSKHGKLAALEKSLTKRGFAMKLIKKLEKSKYLRQMELSMPKFDFGSKLGDLKGILEKKFGVSDVFDMNRADLSGINGKRDLFVSSVIHQTFISVHENGTEAAAATGVEISIRSRPLVSLSISQPFIFLIYDRDNNVFLFVGRVYSPV